MKISSVVFALALSSAEAVRMSKTSIERALSGKGTGKTGNTGSSGDIGNPCDLCKDGRPDSIKFKYVPTDPRAHEFEKHTCGLYGSFPGTAELIVKDKNNNELFSGTVTDGMEFTVSGPFEADSFFEFVGFSGLDDGGNTCVVHTSCSDELLPGYENRIGPVQLGDGECDPGTQPPTDDECLICDSANKVRPSPLTIQYQTNGQNSKHQTMATCVAGTYPSPTTITVSDKNGNLLETIPNVVDGMKFEIGATYELPANSYMAFDGNDSCTLHTSCSQPLVVNDVIGPFKLLAGNDCDEKPPSCIAVDKTSYTCGESINVSFDLTDPDPNDPMSPYEAMRDDWIGIYPCDTALFFHASVWQWTCGSRPLPGNTECVATPTGELVFDGVPDYNNFGPDRQWPLPAGCWKAVVLRNDGPSVPPYVSMCESTSFDITC